MDDEFNDGPPGIWLDGLSAEGRVTADAAAQRHYYDLADLVEIWAGCARIIGLDEGEKYHDDYFYYLSIRADIDAVAAEMSEPDAEVVRRIVEPADSYFRACTVDDGGRALAQKFRPPSDAWYWRRLPRRGPIVRSLHPTSDSE